MVGSACRKLISVELKAIHEEASVNQHIYLAIEAIGLLPPASSSIGLGIKYYTPGLTDPGADDYFLERRSKIPGPIYVWRRDT